MFGAILERGFRPFFLLGALYAGFFTALWVAVLSGWAAPPRWIAATRWHAHEMVFGFAAAAIAGFLLTAVPNWTGRPALRGAPLGALALLWLAGRVLFATADHWPPLLVATVDVAFLPALALAISPSIAAAGVARHAAFPALLLVLAAANAVVLADALGWLPNAAPTALRAAVYGVAMMITLLGGRIVPAFTTNALRHAGHAVGPIAPALPDLVALPAVITFAVLDVAGAPAWARGAAAAVAAVALAARLARWRGHRALGDPLVWSLHLGYAWLPIGFALLALAAAGIVPPIAGVHALGAGAIGTMIVAVASRVALGHTGRPLAAPPSAVAAYVLVTAGAALRVASAAVGTPPIAVGGWVWAAAFAVFAAGYAAILVRPRADGAAG